MGELAKVYISKCGATVVNVNNHLTYGMPGTLLNEMNTMTQEFRNQIWEEMGRNMKHTYYVYVSEGVIPSERSYVIVMARDRRQASSAVNKLWGFRISSVNMVG